MKTTNETATPANTATFTGLATKRRTVGLVAQAVTGIRGRVVALLTQGGTAGVTNDDLAKAWGGNGRTDKVAECLNILAGDKYGYPVQRLSHNISKGLDRYRFDPEAKVVAPAVAPDSAATASTPAPGVATPATPPVDPEPSKAKGRRARKGGKGEGATA